jgi:hypothetical protein
MGITSLAPTATNVGARIGRSIVSGTRNGQVAAQVTVMLTEAAAWTSRPNARTHARSRARTTPRAGLRQCEIRPVLLALKADFPQRFLRFCGQDLPYTGFNPCSVISTAHQETDCVHRCGYDSGHVANLRGTVL